MTVSIVAVGIDKWEVSSLPMIESVKRFEPNADIVLVDNAADEPYPTDAGARVVRLDKRVSMAEAMNYGAMFTKASWMLFANNDILCTAPFIEMVDALDKKAMYGVDILNWWGRRWIDGWVMAVPRGVWHKAGLFDQKFIYAGFEDADYCFRVEQAGYKVDGAQLPFIHKELHSRFTMPDYMAQREENIKYLYQKWGIE